MLEEFIGNWLSAIPDVSQQAPTLTPPRKRRRLLYSTPANRDKRRHDRIPLAKTRYMSPPSTRAEGSKRLPPSDDETAPMDNDPTPRPPRSKRLQTARSESSYSLSGQSQDSSGRFTPIKLIQVLELDPRGLRFDDLSQFHKLPPSIDALLEDMEVIAEGQGIVSPARQEELMETSQTHRDFKWVPRRVGCFDSRRDAVGHTPSPREVMDVLAAAAECSASMHPEFNWNTEVHQRLLSLAYRPSDREPFGHLVNFTGTTIASIVPEYGNSTKLKKVDFCVYIDPANEDPCHAMVQSAIARIRQVLPGNVFNFTDFVPLKGRPIAFSIETKKPSEGFETAKLQLGVWQMAHWCFLQQLMVRLGHEDSLTEAGPEANDPGLSHPLQSTKLPIFIPGIIVQGHDWHLVISTLEDQQTKIWQKVTMGSTSSSKGIYQIVNALQVLRSWVTKTYWPWLRKMILESPIGQP